MSNQNILTIIIIIIIIHVTIWIPYQVPFLFQTRPFIVQILTALSSDTHHSLLVVYSFTQELT